MKLKNLEDCIYDANETQARLERQMNKIVSLRSDYLSHKRALDVENLELKDARKILAKERKRVDALRKHLEALKQSISGRKAAIDAGAENRAVAKKNLLSNKLELHQTNMDSMAISTAITAQRRAVLDDLAKIFPIEHVGSSNPSQMIFYLQSPHA